MHDPVVAADGWTCDRGAFLALLPDTPERQAPRQQPQHSAHCGIDGNSGDGGDAVSSGGDASGGGASGAGGSGVAVSPVTGRPLEHCALIPNRALAGIIEARAI